MEGLTPEEATRVREAVRRVETDLGYLDLHRREIAPEFERLARAWDGLGASARSIMALELEERCGSSLDVGAVARDLADGAEGRRGERLRSHVHRAAASALFTVWVERGNDAVLGNLARRRELDQEPYPACQFVAAGLRRLFPEELADETMAIRRADSLLRSLGQAGALPYRKKGG